MAVKNGYYIIAGPEFKAVADELGVTKDDLELQLHAGLDSIVGPTEAAVRAEALDLPAYGRKQSGLRGRLAAGVGVETDLGYLRFTTAMPEGQEALPRGEDSGTGGWRHPVWGDRNVWVHQNGGSWFREPIGRDEKPIQERLNSVLEQAAENIGRAGHA